MGPQEPIKGSAQLNRQNYFSLTQIRLVYCLTRKTLKCNSTGFSPLICSGRANHRYRPPS